MKLHQTLIASEYLYEPFCPIYWSILRSNIISNDSKRSVQYTWCRLIIIDFKTILLNVLRTRICFYPVTNSKNRKRTIVLNPYPRNCIRSTDRLRGYPMKVIHRFSSGSIAVFNQEAIVVVVVVVVIHIFVRKSSFIRLAKVFFEGNDLYYLNDYQSIGLTSRARSYRVFALRRVSEQQWCHPTYNYR